MILTMPKPLYTPENCSNPAYQLDWSYSLFWRDRVAEPEWLEELKQLNDRDHIRILQHEFQPPNVGKFLISTRPELAPILIAQRVKGRLQHLIRNSHPDAFRRNYCLRSIGSTRRDKLEHYLASQLSHHRMADARVDERLQSYQIHDPLVNLSRPQQTAHAQYWYNLHIVLVNDGRHREIRDARLQRIHDVILGASRKNRQALSRAAILADHTHLTMACHLEESPVEVVLSYMNNIAYTCGMTAVLRHGYYVGTFSEYDLGVIPRASAESRAPPSKLGGGVAASGGG